MRLITPPISTTLTLSNPTQTPEIELQLLLCCARTHLETEQVGRLRQLATQKLDWPYLLELANSHSLMPLLYQQLKKICPELVPPAILEQLHQDFNANAFKNIAMTGELLRLLEIFHAQKIAVLAFKGPVLSQIAYGNLALRQFVDLDILITPTEICRATQLLVAQGYQPQFNLTERQQARYAKSGYEQGFWNEAKQIKVDLHWSLLHPHFSFSPDPNLVWTKPDPICLGRNSVQTLSPENLLLFLCAHGARHNWSSLHLICDITVLLQTHANLNWNEIQRNSGKLGTKRMFLLGLHLAHHLLGATLPAAILREIEADPTLQSLSREVQKQLFQTKGVADDYGDTKNWGQFEAKSKNLARLGQAWHFRAHYQKRLKAWYFRDNIYLKSMESRRDQLWYWVDEMTTPTPLEWAAIPLPAVLFPLYYLIRPIRLTLKYLLRQY